MWRCSARPRGTTSSIPLSATLPLTVDALRNVRNGKDEGPAPNAIRHYLVVEGQTLGISKAAVGNDDPRDRALRLRARSPRAASVRHRDVT
jgi:hypothetical protein